MKGSNDSMMLRGADAPALGARSGGCGQASAAGTPTRRGRDEVGDRAGP